MNELHLFAGAGGGILGGQLIGHKCVCAVEWEPFAQAILVARQNDKTFPPFPIWDNVQTFNGKPWQGIVDVVAGGFPCFTAGTLVLTWDGYRPIEQLSVGDKVLSHKGVWRKVTSVMQRQAESTRVISGQGFPNIRTTDEHPFYTKKKGGVNAKWVDASELTKQSYVGQVLPKEPATDKNSINLWWIVGRYLADGWRAIANGKGRVVICCNHKEADELYERIQRVFPCTRADERTVTKFHICQQRFHAFLEQFGSRAAGKLIPGWVLGLDKEKAESLLDGYLTGDGCRHKTAWKATSVSRALILGIAAIAQRARGTVASIHEAELPDTCVIEGRTVNRQKQYQIVISDSNNRAWVENNYGWKPVRGNTVAGPAEVFNISVEVDESYVADGVIVHNCQDISIAGKGKGLSGERSGMWFEMLRIVCEIQPSYCFIENSPMLASRGLDRVLADLAGAGFDARWCVLSARDVGAAHRRERMWILAFNTNGIGGSVRKNAVKRNIPRVHSGKSDPRVSVRGYVSTDAILSGKAASTDTGTHKKEKALGTSAAALKEKRAIQNTRKVSGPVSHSGTIRGSSGFSRFKIFNTRWPVEPRVPRMVNGLAHWSNRTKATGNGQVSRVAAAAFLLLKDAYLNGY